MREIKLLAIVALGLGFVVSPLSAADDILHESLSVSLAEAVAVGVRTNPEYGIVAANRRATDEELAQGRALFLPSIDVTGDTGFEHTDDVNTRGANPPDGEEDLYRAQISTTLTQMLFDGFESHYEVKRQKARVGSAASRVRETVELVGLDVVEAYLNVLRQRYLLSIADQNVSDHEKIMRQITDGVTAGRTVQADLEQARARLAAAKATRADTMEALQNSESEYVREVGSKAGKLVMPKVPYDALMPSRDEEVSAALATSPTMKIYENDIEVAYAEARQSREAYYPEIDLAINGTQANDVAGVDGRDTSASALVRLNWNLYRGGGDVAREREFIHRHSQAKETRADAARALEDDVRQSWSSMVAAGTRAEQFHNQAAANEQVASSYKDQFDLNRRTLLDVLDAQNELFVSKSNAVNAEFLQMFAVYRLLGLRGALFQALDIEQPPETVVAGKDKWKPETEVKAY